MSLKAFHIVFVVASIGLAVFFGVWSLRGYAASGGTLELSMGIGSLAASVGLLIYGALVLKKLKKIDFL